MKSFKFLVPLAILASGIVSAHAKTDSEDVSSLPPTVTDDHVFNFGSINEDIAVNSHGDVFDFVLKRAEGGTIMAYHRSHRSHSSHSSHYSHRSSH